MDFAFTLSPRVRPPLPACPARREDVARARLFRFLESCASATVVTRITRRMADAGLRRVVPSDLYPLVLGFLRDNQLSSVANKFVKATGAVSAELGSWAGGGGGSPQGCGP